MARDRYIEINTTLSGGLNLQPNYSTLEECSDCRNVWAPNGELQIRPGYEGIDTFAYSYNTGAISEYNKWLDGVLGDFYADFYVFYDDTDSSFKNKTEIKTQFGASELVGMESMQIGDYAYFGQNNLTAYAYTVASAVESFGFIPFSNAVDYNTTTCTPIFEYWNGSNWTWLNVVHGIMSSTDIEFERYSGTFLGVDDTGSGTSYAVGFVPPADWTASVIEDETKFWYRIGLVEGSVSMDNVYNALYKHRLVDNKTIFNIGHASFRDGHKYFYWINSAKDYAAATALSSIIVTDGIQHRTNFVEFTTSTVADTTQSSYANISLTREIFLTGAGNLYTIPVDSYTPKLATVDLTDAAIGPGAPFDVNSIVLDSSFPNANLLAFHKNRLWFADIQDDQRRVQWGGPVPYHKIMPSLAYTYVGEGRGQDITALYSFDEHLIVADTDRMWRMAFAEIDEFGVDHYIPIEIPGGVGIVAQRSIQSVKSIMIFLAEGGVYFYNGVQAKKASMKKRRKKNVDVLEGFWKRITRGARHKAVSVHWAARNAYLLALPIDGSEVNNVVLVWDYINDTWWLWNNFLITAFLRVDSGLGADEIYFVGNDAHIYRFQDMPLDNGAAITAYAESQRINQSKFKTIRLREVEVLSTNEIDNIKVTARANDSNSTKSITLDYTEALENDISTGISLSAADAEWTPDALRERSRTAYIKLTGESFKIKIENVDKGKYLRIRNVGLRGMGISLRSSG